jgi:hypothetical protein
MTVLTVTKTWREPNATPRRLAAELTPEEQIGVRRALTFLRVQAGSTAKLAATLGVGRYVISRALWKNGKPGALLALRVARLSKQPIDVILLGNWPPDGTCPHCGRM